MYFRDDDLTIINFEGTIPEDTDERVGGGYNFKGAKDYVNIVTSASIEVCNLANNHATDFGESGYEHTAQNLEAAGLAVCGFDKVYNTVVNGVRVTVCGYTEWRCDMKESVAKVEELRKDCDLLIVNMHWGAEKWNEATDVQKRWGHAIIDAGADIIIGNHSHVISCIEMYKGKYILYSLGNFCFGGNGNPEDKDCFIFQQEFHMNASGEMEDKGIKVIPCSISSVTWKNNFQPTPLEGDEYTRVLNKIKRWSKIDESQIVWLDDEPYRTDQPTPRPSPTPAAADEEESDEAPAETPAETPGASPQITPTPRPTSNLTW